MKIQGYYYDANKNRYFKKQTGQKSFKIAGNDGTSHKTCPVSCVNNIELIEELINRECRKPVSYYNSDRILKPIMRADPKRLVQLINHYDQSGNSDKEYEYYPILKGRKWIVYEKPSKLYLLQKDQFHTYYENPENIPNKYLIISLAYDMITTFSMDETKENANLIVTTNPLNPLQSHLSKMILVQDLVSEVPSIFMTHLKGFIFASCYSYEKDIFFHSKGKELDMIDSIFRNTMAGQHTRVNVFQGRRIKMTSDILTINKTNEGLICCGCRNGSIIMNDPRDVNTNSIFRMNSSISCIKSLEDNYSFLVSTRSDEIHLLDIRNGSNPLITYENHPANVQHRHPISPCFSMSHDESFLYSSSYYQSCISIFDIKFSQPIKTFYASSEYNLRVKQILNVSDVRYFDKEVLCLCGKNDLI